MAAAPRLRNRYLVEPLIVRNHPFREDILRCYFRNLHKIRSFGRRFNTGNAVFNFELLGDQAVSELDLTRNVYSSQQHAFRVNFSCGFILFNNETHTCRYFHPSWVNQAAYETTPFIHSFEDWRTVSRRVCSTEFLLEQAAPRENSSETCVWVTQLFCWTWALHQQILM